MNTEYYNWLHELTTIGYRKNIMIPTELMQEVKKLFNNGTPPAKALDAIIGIAHVRGISINKK